MAELKPIGVIKSPVKEAVDENWGAVVSEIHLDEGLNDGLKGLSDFSHVVVIFHMHHAAFDPHTDLVRRPRGLPDMPLTGIFAQRAKHRLNPIGITAVKLLAINGNVLIVKGLDAVDGTPVLDIKPYAPGIDSIENATVPGWMERLMKGYF